MRPIVSELTGDTVDPDVFHKLAARSSVRVVKASLMYAGSPVVDNLPVIDGSFRSNRLAAVRSYCTVVVPAMQTLDALGWVEGDPVPELLGYELVVKRGLRVREFWPTPGGTILIDTTGSSVVGAPGQPGTERYDIVCQCGVFPVQSDTLDDEDWTWTIEAADRSWKLDQAKLEDSVAWTSADTLEDRIADMVADALGDVEMMFAGEEHTAPWVVHERRASPLEIIHRQATALGYQAYFDEGGRFVWEPEPNLTFDEAAAELVDGDGGMLISCKRSADYRGLYNKIVAESSAPDIVEELVGVAVNDTPGSPTMYGGAYGKAPAFITSPHIRTQNHATQAAAARLGATLDMGRAKEIVFVPHPAIREGDVVRVRRSRLGIDEVVVLDAKQEDWSPAGGPDRASVHPPSDPTEEQ